MLSNLFKPKVINKKCYHMLIGNQHLIILEPHYKKDEMIFDKSLSKLLKTYDNIYWFSSYAEMEKELDILLNNTKENYIVIIN